MLFGEPLFLFVLLPAAIGAFYVLGHYSRPALPLFVIVLTSGIFYAPYGITAWALLATSLCLNLLIGIQLANHGEIEQRRRQTLLVCGLVMNFAALAAFKYLNQVTALVAPSAAPILGVAIPAGISFYTFHQAVFLHHAFRRQPEVVTFLKSPPGPLGKFAVLIRYAGFVAFFPQLIIGPITYLSEIVPQIWRPGFGRLRITNIQVGATLIIVGLFKKLCIADSFARSVNPIFDGVAGGALISQPQAFLAIIGYSFQLYFDFSGYSDIALGIARCFGFRLPINFDSPLRATGIIDFWRRWNITLTRIVVLYIFTPLSLWGTRAAAERGYRGWRRRALSAWLPFLANFQIIALWHAATYTFVVFGLVHGIWYIIETEVRATKAFKIYRSRTSANMRTIAGMAITVVPLMLSFALFRSETLTSFGKLVSAAAGLAPSPQMDVYINRREWARIAIAAVIVYSLPNIYEALRNYRPGILIFSNPSTTLAQLRATWRPNLSWGVVLCLLAIFAFFSINVPTPFLYTAF